MSDDTNTGDRYRVFCAYGPHYREPGCGWETVVDSEAEAQRLEARHTEGQTHTADYERSLHTDTERSGGDAGDE